MSRVSGLTQMLNHTMQDSPMIGNIEKIYNDEIDGAAEINATALSVIKDTIYKTQRAEGILVKKLKISPIYLQVSGSACSFSNQYTDLLPY